MDRKFEISNFDLSKEPGDVPELTSDVTKPSSLDNDPENTTFGTTTTNTTEKTE